MSGRLVLIRHAKSDYPWGVSDHDRPLSERGRRDAPQIGVWLAQHVEHDGSRAAVRVSTARRAQSTWAAAFAAMSTQTVGAAGTGVKPRVSWDDADIRDEERIYEADVPTLLAVAREAATACDLVVMVGHNPGLADLIAQVAQADDLRDAALAKFPTSAIAVLSSADPLRVALDGRMRVSAFAVPRGIATTR